MQPQCLSKPNKKKKNGMCACAGVERGGRAGSRWALVDQCHYMVVHLVFDLLSHSTRQRSPRCLWRVFRFGWVFFLHLRLGLLTFKHHNCCVKKFTTLQRIFSARTAWMNEWIPACLPQWMNKTVCVVLSVGEGVGGCGGRVSVWAHALFMQVFINFAKNLVGMQFSVKSWNREIDWLLQCVLEVCCHVL